MALRALRSRRRRRLTLLDVVLLTAIPIGVGLYVFAAACLEYHHINQYRDWWSIRFTSVRIMAENHLRRAASAPFMARLRNEIPVESETHETIRLHVDRSTWREVSTNVADNWGRWIPARLVRGADLHDVEIRFRGDGSAHWTNAKKSLSIKTPRDELYMGYRRLNLTVKGVMGQDLVTSLADDFGLLCHDTSVVPVFVNDEFYGLHRFIERLDESFLRRNGLMPGNIYRGDCLLRGDVFKGLPRELFLNPYIWDRTAFNDRPGAPGTRALFALIEDLNTSTFEEHLELMERFDRDELSRLMALQLVAGDTHHMSGSHNQFWYEDPSSGKLRPIVWDLLYLNLGYALPGSDIHRLWEAVLRDPRLMDSAYAYLAPRIQDGRLGRLAKEREALMSSLYAPHIKYERHRRGAVPSLHHIGPGRVHANMKQLWQEWFADARAAVGDGAAEDGTHVVDVVVDGTVGVELRGLRIEGTGLRAATLRADSDLSGDLTPQDRALAAAATVDGDALRLVLDQAEWLLPGTATDRTDFVTEPLHYRFFVTAADASGAAAEVTGVTADLHGRYRDTPVAVEPLTAGTPLASTLSWHPWKYVTATHDVHLRGEVRLSETLVVEEGSTLTIDAGTTLLLEPDVSILARGRVDARGTAERPIRVVNTDPQRPWGVFALQGSGANASHLEHVRFTGGGGALVEGVEYKGSVCVHNAHEVVFESCSFAANMRCDDLFNAVAADVDLLRCDFERANADSIDYDLSTGDIFGCRIVGSGNDGIDLMTCSPRIVSTVISGSGDKGISVGEDAAPVIFDCVITDCVRGMEVKDMSAPIVLNTVIERNELGLLQRHKNWRYPAPGRAKLVETRLADNAVDYETSPGAFLTRIDHAPWMRSRFGFDASTQGVGRPLDWQPTEPARVVQRWAPPTRFANPTDGWRRLGHVRRVQVDDRDLVGTFQDGEGALGTELDWELAEQDVDYVLVLECSATDLLDARAILSTGEVDTEVPLELADRSDRASYTVVPLESGRYNAMALAARPDGRRGELRLHEWMLLALPAARP